MSTETFILFRDSPLSSPPHMMGPPSLVLMVSRQADGADALMLSEKCEEEKWLSSEWLVQLPLS